jgi:hypothetical protein
MTSPGLLAELELLTQALDLPGADVAETLTRLAANAQTAVDSYLGLTIAITANRSPFDVTVLKQGTRPDDIHASVLVPLSSVADASSPLASVVLILYAGTAGAFIDLAADLSWITGRPLTDFRLDANRDLPSNYTDQTSMSTMSTINQALGVLIGDGFSPEQAERDLHARAVTAGIDLLGAATLILAAVGPSNREPEPA